MNPTTISHRWLQIILVAGNALHSARSLSEQNGYGNTRQPHKTQLSLFIHLFYDVMGLSHTSLPVADQLPLGLMSWGGAGGAS